MKAKIEKYDIKKQQLTVYDGKKTQTLLVPDNTIATAMSLRPGEVVEYAVDDNGFVTALVRAKEDTTTDKPTRLALTIKDRLIVRQTCLKAASEFWSRSASAIWERTKNAVSDEFVLITAERFEEWVTRDMP